MLKRQLLRAKSTKAHSRVLKRIEERPGPFLLILGKRGSSIRKRKRLQERLWHRRPTIHRNLLKGGAVAIATVAQRKVYFSPQWVPFGGEKRHAASEIRVINRWALARISSG